MKHKLLGVVAGVAASLVVSAGPAAAAPPEHFEFSDSYVFDVDCGDFQATVEGALTGSVTVFSDEQGDFVREFDRIRAPRDVWTNLATGKTIVVRGEFNQTYTAIPGTDDVTVTITGFRYMVNEPGSGATVQEVGRIVYAEPEELTVLFAAGVHDLAIGEDVEPELCAALG
jgi:hypothetical protein